MTDAPPSEFTDTIGAAEYTGYAPSTLETLRSRGGGPRFYRAGKFGRLIRYTYADLKEWLLSNPVEPSDVDPR